MSHGDFDLDGLARYLHLHPQQVAKLVDRGEIPSRRIGGELRFSAAEVHHWLEDRIGVSGEEELARMESAMERSHAVAQEAATIAELIPPGGVALPLKARTRNSVILAMVRLAEGAGLLWDAEKMAEAVKQRENLHSTALDNGVALLHPRRPLTGILAEPWIVLGITPQGIPFGGATGLTDIYFLLGSTSDAGHLRTLARLSRLIAAPGFLDELREAHDESRIRHAVLAYEQGLPN